MGILAACTTATSPPPPAPPNFVFVLIDTLRADHVGAYGYERETTPFIDSLAETGLVFEQVVSQAPWTGASMASLWTSRYPSEVGAGVLPDESGSRVLAETGSTKLRAGVPTLAGLLSAAGYGTIGVVTNAYAGRYFGLLRGFDVQAQKNQDASRVTDVAIAKLDQHLAQEGSAPFFLYVHYLDVHEPTFPPEPHRTLFSPAGDPPTVAHSRWQFYQGEDPNDPEFRAFRRHKIDLYDASIHYVDSQVERLARHVEAVAGRDSTVFIIASDHGEELWDHTDFERDTHLDPRGIAGVGHGQSLFGELTDVPLVWHGPGVPVGRVRALVRNLDVAPTILNLATLDAAKLDLRGIDLLEVARGPTPPSLDGFSENIAYGVEAKSLQRNGWKLIRYDDTKTGRTKFLFDRRVDPTEHQDRAEEAPPQTRRLEAALDATLSDLDTTRGAATELDDDTRAQLKAIGYIDE